MPVYKQNNAEEEAFWVANGEYNIILSRMQLVKALGVDPFKLTIPLIREKLYEVGIKPDEFIVRRHRNHPGVPIEIRFAGPEVRAIIELSGLLKD
jgi:hypothetical protein